MYGAYIYDEGCTVIRRLV